MSPKSTAVTGRRAATPAEMGRLVTVPVIGRPIDWVRWKDILDMDDLVPKVLCEEEPENNRDPFLVGEGVTRRPEDWVLLLDMED